MLKATFGKNLAKLQVNTLYKDSLRVVVFGYCIFSIYFEGLLHFNLFILCIPCKLLSIVVLV